MINAIIASISNALYSEFGYENHMEEIKQGFKEPCFFIQCLNPNIRQFLGKRYFRHNKFCIQYFPKSKTDGNAECYTVAETLQLVLEVIPVLDAVLRGTEMNYEMVDGVLNFFVNYNCFVYKLDEKVLMGTIQLHKTNVKG